MLSTYLTVAAIVLNGISGDRMSARASFDANNVRVGDPLTLTIEFRGTADRDLHPPELSREVDATVWKIDDASAKTATGESARRLSYRVRPLREGVQYFPALEFTWEGGSAATRSIPVHVRPGVHAALSGGDECGAALPMPDGITIAVASRALGADEAFAWRKACAKATAEAFAAFDFPEARLNEAAAHTIDGNWAKALKIYYRLEWLTGQTPQIERGIVAALARKNGDAAQELPAWRIALRPLLRHAWKGRSLIVALALAALAAFFFASGRLIRRLAAVALCAALAGFAQEAQGAQGAQQRTRRSSTASMFEEIERRQQEMLDQMEQLMNFGGGGFSQSMSFGGGQMQSKMIVNGKEVPPPEIGVSVALSTNDVQIGQAFEFVLSVEAPRSVELSGISIQPDEMFGMVATGPGQQLADGASANPSNRVIRAAFPVRYDVPFKGEMGFTVTGQYSFRSRGFMMGFSMPFSERSAQIPVDIKPLPTENQPKGFSGAIGTSFALSQTADRTKVATNDVVRVRCRLLYDGYMPLGAVDDVLSRKGGRELVWERYFVASGSDVIPPQTLCYYDTKTREYKWARSKPVRLEYVTGDDAANAAVAIDKDAEAAAGRTLVLRFAPSESAPVVERTVLPDGAPEPAVTERKGEWRRVDTGRHAGWTRDAQ